MHAVSPPLVAVQCRRPAITRSEEPPERILLAAGYSRGYKRWSTSRLEVAKAAFSHAVAKRGATSRLERRGHIAVQCDERQYSFSDNT